MDHGSPQKQTFRVAVEALFRHRLLLPSIVSVIMFIAAAAVLLSPKQYHSEMKLLIQNARSNAVITPDRTTMASTVDVSEQQINSELEVLESEDVLGRVADPQWDPATSAGRSAADVKRHVQKVSELQKRITIAAPRKSNVIRLSAVGSSPKDASVTLNAVANEYLAKRRELSRPGGATSFFAGEAARYKQEFEAANNALVEFQRVHEIPSVGDRVSVLHHQIEDVDNQLRTAEISLAESQQKQQQALRQQETVPQRETTLQKSFANQYSIEQMQATLIQLKNKRTEMLTRYKPNDRLVVELDQQIAQTSAALKDAFDQHGHEDTTDVSPVWQQLNNSVILEKVNQGALRGRRDSLLQERAKLVRSFGLTEGLATEYANLESRAEETKNNFKLFTDKHDQAQIEDQMDEHKLVNVAIAESPTMSYKAYSPKPLQTMLLAGITGVLLGLGAIYFSELYRSTVSNAYELELATDTPVLASIPLESEARVLKSSRAEGSAAIVGDRLNVGFGSPASRLAHTLRRSDSAAEGANL